MSIITSVIDNVIAEKMIFPPILDEGNLPSQNVFWIDDQDNDMADEVGDFMVFKL